MWPFSKQHSFPGVKHNADGTMDFFLTDEEARQADLAGCPTHSRFLRMCGFIECESLVARRNFFSTRPSALQPIDPRCPFLGGAFR
jgi:hypothetical protein